ncbi:MAG: hypothetical protein J5535_05180 [Firmicutes bacterium]|nr:hypothetical protein [Bacillota bacterium]
MEKKPVKGKTVKGKLITAVTALSLFTGITAGSVFDSPSEITLSDVKEPTPVVEVVDLGKKDASMEIQAPDEALIEEEKKTLKQRIKERIQAMPAAVRTVVVLPLYYVGTVVTKLAGAAFSTVMAPVLAALLKWVVLALVIFAGVAVALKAIFPDIPLKKLLRPRNFLYVLLSVIVIALIDKAMPLIFSDYRKWADTVAFTLGLIAVIIIVVPTAVSIARKRRAKSAA